METLKWETVKTDSIDATRRLPIFGGWLVKTKCEFKVQEQGGWTRDFRHSLTFVPDPTHNWDLSIDYSYRSPKDIPKDLKEGPNGSA